MSDLISRSDAIGAVKEERFPIDSDYAEGFMAALDKVEWILKEWLPSAQPETHEERTETHSCDCIERQSAIDATRNAKISFTMKSDIDFANYRKEIQEMFNNILDAQEKALKELPPAQPEIRTQMSSANLISRQAAIRKLKKMATQAYIDKLNGSAETVINCCIDVIERQIPSAQPERKTGRWIPQKGGGLCCSECGGYALDEPDGNFVHVAVPSKFCPHCGARMEESEE